MRNPAHPLAIERADIAQHGDAMQVKELSDFRRNATDTQPNDNLSPFEDL
jgi:hypothetical protein